MSASADTDDTPSQVSTQRGGGLRADDLQRLNAAAATAPSAPDSPRDSLLAAAFTKSQQQKQNAPSNNDDTVSLRSSKTGGEGSSWTTVGDEFDDFLAKWTTEKVQSLQSAVKLAPWHDVSHHLQTVNMAMTGDELTRWLRDSNFARTHDDALAVGDAMLRRRMLFQFNKKSTKRGFWAEDGIKYTLDDQLAKGNSVFSKLSRIATAKKTDWGPPVKYKPLGTFVYAIIEERERRLEDGDYSPAHLKESDGLNFSAPKDEVPVPSVSGASPDECDWAHEWEIVNTDNTDGDGWRYQVSDFREPAKFIKADALNKNFSVRLREWQRPGAKRMVREKRSGAAGIAGDETPEEKTEQEIEDDKKKEMLIKTSQFIARVPRKGTLELQVLQGVDLLKICDSCVVVENRDFSLKSDACPKAQRHEWAFRLDVPIASDMEPTRITVLQANKLGKKVVLGQCEVLIAAHELQATQSIPLKLRDVDASQSAMLAQADDLGTVSVSWKFMPDETAAAQSAAPKTSGAKRCVLSLTILKGEGLTKERKRVGPCNMPVPGGVTKSKCFFRLLYLGEFCDMFAQSPMFVFQPVVDFNWQTSIPLIVSAPVELQFWVADLPTPVGVVSLVYDQQQQQLLDPTETGNQVTMEIKPIVVDGISSAAVATSLGTLTMKVTWVPEMNTLEELISMGIESVAISSCSTRKVKNLLETWEEPAKVGKRPAAPAAAATAAATPQAAAAGSKQPASNAAGKK